MPKAKAKVRSEDSAVYALSATPFALSAEEQEVVDAATKILERRVYTGEKFDEPRSAGTYCALRLATSLHEQFLVLFLTTKHQLIAAETLFQGTIDGADVHVRLVAQRALHHNAAAIILAHNHPSGAPIPSAADRLVTARIRESLRWLDVRVLDHFIVTPDGKALSMAEKGDM